MRYDIIDREGNKFETVIDSVWFAISAYRETFPGRCATIIQEEREEGSDVVSLNICGEPYINVEGHFLCPHGDSKSHPTGMRKNITPQKTVRLYVPQGAPEIRRQKESLEGQMSLPGLEGEAERTMRKNKKC